MPEVWISSCDYYLYRCQKSGFHHVIIIYTDARSLSFKMNSFGTLCLLQDAHINMPFQSWEIRPHKLNSAVFSIIAAIVEVEIEIKVRYISQYLYLSFENHLLNHSAH